jgi:predicted transcriptional regulator
MPFRELMPPPTAEETRLLNADIAENGVREPIVVSSEGEILSGHRRYEADPGAPVQAIDTKGWTKAEKEAFVLKMNTLRRDLDAAGRQHVMREQKRIAHALRDEGRKQGEIAKVLGVPQQTLSDWFRPPDSHRSGENQTAKRPTVTQQQIEQVVEQAELGDTQRQISQELGISQPTVQRILKENREGQLDNRLQKIAQSKTTEAKEQAPSAVAYQGLDEAIAAANGLSYQDLRSIWALVECLKNTALRDWAPRLQALRPIDELKQFQAWLKKQLRARGRRAPKPRR